MTLTNTGTRNINCHSARIASYAEIYIVFYSSNKTQQM